MIELIKKVFGMGSSPNFAALVKSGAVIVDVRSKSEYSSGHIKGSINIPVDELKKNFHRFPDKQRAIITCCASGARSGSAFSILKSQGYIHVMNGGGWLSLQHKI
jgi:phage shock protein E